LRGAAQPGADADQTGNQQRAGECRDEWCHGATSLDSV
jgi:hypothetical protein